MLLNENRTADAAAILGICIVNLPTYSPNLNPIERLNIVEIDAELKFLRFSMNEEKMRREQ